MVQQWELELSDSIPKGAEVYGSCVLVSLN